MSVKKQDLDCIISELALKHGVKAILAALSKHCYINTINPDLKKANQWTEDTNRLIEIIDYIHH
jgi:hypothetical protein